MVKVTTESSKMFLFFSSFSHLSHFTFGTQFRIYPLANTDLGDKMIYRPEEFQCVVARLVLRKFTLFSFSLRLKSPHDNTILWWHLENARANMRNAVFIYFIVLRKWGRVARYRKQGTVGQPFILVNLSDYQVNFFTVKASFCNCNKMLRLSHCKSRHYNVYKFPDKMPLDKR